MGFAKSIFDFFEDEDNDNQEPGFLDYALSVADSLNPPTVARTLANAAVDVATGAYDYIRTSTPSEVLEDAVDLGGAIARYAYENPAETIVDFIPVVGDVKGYAQDMNEAARLRSQGDVFGAQQVAGNALALAALGVVPGVTEARRAGEIADAAQDAAQDAAETARRIDRAGMGVGSSRERVGTTGQYIGAPSGIDTAEKLEELRTNYIDTAIKGQGGANWYQDSSDFIQNVSPRTGNQSVADVLGITSQGTGVDPNLGFTIKAFNQRAAGLPVDTGRFPNTQNPLIESVLDGSNPNLGPKRQPFASNLSVSWNPEIAVNPVHDIWDGRAWGYVNADGKPWDGAFSRQQHDFMDRQAEMVIGVLNDIKAGDRADWDALNSQAAAWTGAQIDAGRIKPEDAALHYGSYSPKYRAFGTYEQTPGKGTGHLEGMADLSFEERKVFNDMAPWVNESGQDSLYSSGGLLTEPTVDMIGAYTPERGVLEINPGNVARPLVQMENINGSRSVSPRDANILTQVEGSRAYIDAQNAGAWNKVIPGAKMGERNSLTLNIGENVSTEQMANLANLAAEEGFFVVNTGGGRVNIINDVYSETGAARTGTSLGRELKNTDLAQRIQEAVGLETPIDLQRQKIETGFIDYQKAWAAGQGSGKATAQFLSAMNESPTLRANIEPELRRKARLNYERDEVYAAERGLPIREDVQNARRIFFEGGWNALDEAMQKGAILPAVGVSALLLPSFFEDHNDNQQMENQTL